MTPIELLEARAAADMETIEYELQEWIDLWDFIYANYAPDWSYFDDLELFRTWKGKPVNIADGPPAE